MKFLTPLAALMALSLIVSEIQAQPPGRGKGKPPAGQNGGPGRRPGPGMDRDPAQMVQRMIEQYDQDGDQKLDARELTAMFTAMRERRGNGSGRPGAGPEGARRRPEDGKQGQRPQGAGKRRGAEEKEGNAGGEKPRRPPAE